MTERIAALPKGIDAKVFYHQILQLQEQKTLFEERLQNWEENHRQAREEPISFEDFQKFTAGLKALTEKCSDPEEQAGIIRKQVARIEVNPKGITIQYYVGTTHYLRELGDSRMNGGKGAKPNDHTANLLKAQNDELEFNFNADFTNKKGLVDLTKPASKPLLKYRSNFSFVGCSNTLTSGRPLPSTCNFLQQHDFTMYFENSIEDIFSQAALLYKKGHSLKEISSMTGLPYSSIRDQLVKGGMSLRINKSVSSTEILCRSFKNSTPPPYGYCYLDGALVKELKEYPILQIIEQLYRRGETPTTIANHLNTKKIKTRKGKIWKQPTVFYIMERFKQINKRK